LDNLSSVHSLVYHISNISEEWKLSNPYFIMLRSLLLDKSVTIDLNKLRLNQEYHFIAKMIHDEFTKDKNEAGHNAEEILSIISRYEKQKQQNDAENGIRNLFYVQILKFLDKDLHYNSIKTKNITQFLLNAQVEDLNLKNMLNILCLIYGIQPIDMGKNDNIPDEVGLSLNLLYSRLLLSDASKRNDGILLDYYLRQNKMDKIDISLISSERSQGKLLEVAVYLKAATGNGLYLPEVEKEQYLTNFTKEIFRKKYLSVAKKVNSIEIHGFMVPLWALMILAFAIEATIFALPSFTDSISLGIISIPTKPILELPVWIILIINGLLSGSIFFLRDKWLKQTVRDELWK
jgi:hypothetical protein